MRTPLGQGQESHGVQAAQYGGVRFGALIAGLRRQRGGAQENAEKRSHGELDCRCYPVYCAGVATILCLAAYREPAEEAAES